MKSRTSGLVRRVLLVDDDAAQARLYGSMLEAELGCGVQTTQFPGEALAVAGRNLFDMVVIDVTIDYGNTPFGGLELYQQLQARYGSDSLLAYSKFFSEDMLRRYDFAINFLEVELPVEVFARRLAERVIALRKRQRCFVAMPFVPEFEPMWDRISRCVRRASFRAVRVDRQTFNTSIVERMFRELRAAKMVICVFDRQNPNVFYEAGFAHALSKEVISVTDDHSTLPFDVRDRNAIAHRGDLASLERLLAEKLRNRVESGP